MLAFSSPTLPSSKKAFRSAYYLTVPFWSNSNSEALWSLLHSVGNGPHSGPYLDSATFYLDCGAFPPLLFLLSMPRSLFLWAYASRTRSGDRSIRLSERKKQERRKSTAVQKVTLSDSCGLEKIRVQNALAFAARPR